MCKNSVYCCCVGCRFTGKAMRVLKRTPLAKLAEGDRDSDDDDDGDEYFYKSMKPLPQDTPQQQKTATLPGKYIAFY